MPRTTVSFSAGEHERLKDESNRQERSVNEIVREAVREYLARKAKESKENEWAQS
jgi:metal-responsive CopG/Arc/MetJ family transcriptional regulator